MNGISETVTIRSAEARDLDFVEGANLALALESEGKVLDAPTVHAGVHLALEDPARCLYFVAEISGQRVGQIMVTYEWSDWQNGWLWWVQSVYVAPPHRRRGVFRALYGHVRRLARANPEVRAIRLYVHRDNAQALRTYHDLGLKDAHYLVMEDDLSARPDVQV